MSAGRQHAVTLATGTAAAAGAAARQHAVSVLTAAGPGPAGPVARQHDVSLTTTPGGPRARQFFVKLDITQGARRIVVGGILRTLTRKPRTPNTGPVTPGGWQWGAVKPDATNTGLRQGWTEDRLEQVVGDIVVTAAGARIENKYVRGRIIIRAADVYVGNCVVEPTEHGTTDSACIDANPAAAKRLVVEDCVLRQHPDTGWFWFNGMVGHDYTARRVETYYVVDGFGVFNNAGTAAEKAGPTNVLIEGCYVHDLWYQYRSAADAAADPANGPKEPHSDDHTHNDGIQVQGGTNTVIRGNNIQGFCAPGVGTNNDPAPRGNPYRLTNASNPTWTNQVTGQCILLQGNVSDVTATGIEGNWLDGGGEAQIHVAPGGATPTNTSGGTLRNNRHGRKARVISGGPYYVRVIAPKSATVIGSVFDDTGALVPVSGATALPSDTPTSSPTGLGLAPLGTSPLGV